MKHFTFIACLCFMTAAHAGNDKRPSGEAVYQTNHLIQMSSTTPDKSEKNGEPTGVKLFLDNFEYEEGNLVGKGDWIDFKYNNLGGDPAITLVNSPLQYSGYQNNATGLAIELVGKGGDAAVPFQGIGGTIYASMLVNVSDVTDGKNVVFAFNAGTAPNRGNHFGKLIITKVDDKLVFGIAQKSNIYDENAILYSDKYNFNETILLVVKYYQGPKTGDDFVELFVNPDNLSGSEPENGLRTTEVLAEPATNLNFIELVQNGSATEDYKMLIDAIRIATSWEALFDESEVELVPEIITPKQSYNLGSMKQGDAPLETTVNIKAKDLRSDLTVIAATEGYYTFNTTSIKKEEAESENGVNLTITLDPKNARIKNDLITVSGILVNYQISVEWEFEAEPTGVKLFEDDFEYEAGDLAGNGDWKEYKYFNMGGDPVIKLVDNALSYADYQDEAKGLAAELNGKGMDISAQFQGVGGVVYASLLVNVSEASESGNAIFAFNAGTKPTPYDCFGKLIVKKVGDKLAFGVTQYLFVEDNTVFSEAKYNFNEPVLLVVKYSQGPEKGDDIAELFINPKDIFGAEPEDHLKTTEVSTEPSANLSYIHLIQHSATDDNYKMFVDAVRVATSWEALFDGSAVGLAPEVTTGQGAKINLGTFEQGDAPLEKTVNIKAKNLRSDLTVNMATEGYYTLNATTIKKEEAESENGFDLTITLNPKDAKVQNDLVTFSGEVVNYPILIEWNYTGKADVNTIAELQAIDMKGKYTLINKVHVENVASTDINGTYIYTLKDDSGTLDVEYAKGGSTTSAVNNIKKGNDVRNLCIMLAFENREEEPIPVYTITDSPNLEILETGIRNALSEEITGYVDGKFIAEGAKAIKVYDVTGKRMLEINGEALSMEEIPGAMYIVQFTDESGKVHTLKVMQ